MYRSVPRPVTLFPRTFARSRGERRDGDTRRPIVVTGVGAVASGVSRIARCPGR